MAEPDLFTSVTARSRGMTVDVTARRVIVTLFALISFAALIGFIGQRPSTSTAATPSARLTLSAPTTVRGGIFFQSRISIRALATIEHPRLVLESGWTEGLQVNSIEPAAESESSRDGRVVLSYGKLEAGELLRIWLQFEVNPTSVGTHPYSVELDDGARPLARISRTLRVLP